MASLHHPDSGVRVPVHARTVIGRSSGSTVRLQSRHVSGEHARIVWRAGRWLLRDLGSRNGTFVDGTRLPTGEDHVLEKGARVGFGDADCGWVFADDAPPVAVAAPEDGGEPRAATDGLLVLPDESDPQVTLFRDGEGMWLLESRAERRPVVDGEVVSVDHRTWRITIPARTEATLEASTAMGIRLRFRPSRDEEHVQLDALFRGRIHDLGARTHNFLLLHLARQHAGDDHLPLAERGWVHREDLLRGLKMDPSALRMQIYRARRAYAKAGLPEPERLLERRPDAGTLRLGLPHDEVPADSMSGA